VRNLNEVFIVKYGKTLPKTKILDKWEYPVYWAGWVIWFYSENNQVDKVSLVTCRWNWSGTVWRTNHRKSFVTNNSFFVKPTDEYDYIKYFFINWMLKNTNLNWAISWAAQPQITIDWVSKLNVLVPDKNNIISYIKKWSPIYEEIDILKKQNQNLKETRDILIPKLVSGEVEV
jgi:type I restriction enzyme S subunit